MAVTRDEVAELYVATFNRAPLSKGLDYWTSSDFTLEMVAESFFDQSEAQAIYTNDGEAISSREFVIRVYENLFNRLPAVAGLEYWENELDSGNISQSGMILAVMNGATGDDATILSNKATAGLHYADEGGTGNFSLENIDETDASLENALASIDSALAESVDFKLTAATDELTGTSNDDLFDAPITQNAMAGGVSNTLSTADAIDGGAGNDTLQAELVPEFYGVTGGTQVEIQPDIQNVETILFEAMDATGILYNNGSDLVDGGVNYITVDAKDITDVDVIGSSYSDADLRIENLTTLTSSGTIRNTEAITIVMDHTDNFDSDNDASDLIVSFDEDYLVSGQTSEASAYYFLLDEDAELNGLDERLNRINVDGIRFTLGDSDEVIIISDPNAQTALTHEAFVETLQDELQALIDNGTLAQGSTLTLDYSITDETGLDNGSMSDLIPAIVLTTGDGTTVTPIGYSQVADTLGNYDVYGQFRAQSQTTNDPVSVNVELEKVGRDGEGGYLVIGGEDRDLNVDSDVDQTDGIAVFNIGVNGDQSQPSNLGNVRSTNQALTTVNISNGDEWNGAALTIRDLIGAGQELTLINATAFAGDFSLAMSGITSQQAVTTRFGSGNDSYDWMSVEADGVSSGKEYSISMGGGNDTVSAALDGDSVDAVGESFSLDSGAGNDVINVTSDTSAGVSQQTMFILDNISIDAGSGEDRVFINGYERFNIETESGDDYVEITSVDPADGAAGTWNFGATTGEQPFVDRVLYQAELTVNFAGFESTVIVDTDSAGNFVADQEIINAAIIEAIDESPVLSELLNYTLGTGDQSLTITSDFDGANELSIDLFQPTLVDADAGDGDVLFSSGDLTAIRQGIIDTTGLTSDDLENDLELIAEFNDGTTANLGDGSLNQTGNDTSAAQFTYQFQAAASDATADATIEENYSVINTGTGDDIVVLHSNDDSANTLVFDSEFNHLTVVNFFDDAARTQTGDHILDFTYYLDNQRDPSDNLETNTQSIVDIQLTYDGPESAAAGDDLVGNEFTVVKATFDDDDTFAGLTESNFLAAINDDDGSANYADIDDDTLDADDSPFGDQFVGNVQDHVVFVENDGNRGEYKVFHLTSDLDGDGNVDNEDGDFASATLLGTIDFGAAITEDPLGLANLLGSEPVGGSWDDYYMDYVLSDEDGPVPDIAPDAVDDIITSTVVQGGSLEIDVADLLANDDDQDTDHDDLTIISATDVTGCTAELSGDGLTITFTADADFTGTANFEYTLSDGTLTDTAVVSVDVFDPSVGNTINMDYGETGEISATAASDVFNFNVVTALEDAQTSVTQATITGFDTAADSLQLTLATASSATTLDQLNGIDGIQVLPNDFTGALVVDFGSDANGGEPVIITLAGVTDASLVDVSISV